MKTRKEYCKPSLQIVSTEQKATLLAGSGEPNTFTIYEEGAIEESIILAPRFNFFDYTE